MTQLIEISQMGYAMLTKKMREFKNSINSSTKVEEGNNSKKSKNDIVIQE